jgi:hypothetical protein
MAILNTPMQLARFDGVLEIAIAGKPAPTGDVCCPRLRRNRLAGDGDFEYADAAGGFWWCSGDCHRQQAGSYGRWQC